MGFWSKTKEVAKQVGGALKEEYKERFSKEPKYINMRIEQSRMREKEMEAKASLTEQEARYAKAKLEKRQFNPLVRMAQNVSGGMRSPPPAAMQKGKGKKGRMPVAARDPYAHIFGQNGDGYDHIFGTSKPKKGGDKYAHLFGK